MTHNAPLSQLCFAFVLAVTTGLFCIQHLEASPDEVVADSLPDSDTTEPTQSPKPTESTEPANPEVIDVSEIIPLLEKEDFNSESLALLAKEGELSNFVGGSFLFINASEMKVAVQMGDNRFELNPDQGKLLHPAATHNGGACQVTLSYQREEHWKVFRKTRWMTTKSYRSLIFFHQDAESGQLLVKPVVDILPYDPSKAE